MSPTFALLTKRKVLINIHTHTIKSNNNIIITRESGIVSSHLVQQITEVDMYATIAMADKKKTDARNGMERRKTQHITNTYTHIPHTIKMKQQIRRVDDQLFPFSDVFIQLSRDNSINFPRTMPCVLHFIFLHLLELLECCKKKYNVELYSTREKKTEKADTIADQEKRRLLSLRSKGAKRNETRSIITAQNKTDIIVYLGDTLQLHNTQTNTKT